MTRLVDCSHEVVDGMTTYPGLPGPTITTHMSREDTAQRMAPGISFQIGRVDMVANTGTYIDSPWHFHADGPDLAGLVLEQLADLPAVVVHLDGFEGGVLPDALPAGEYEGHAVLFHTGWDRNWRTDRYGESAPYLTRALVESLLARRVALVGIDSVNIDSITDLTQACSSGPARRGDPDRRAPHASRRAPRAGRALLRRAAEGQRLRDVSRPCLCDDRAMSRLPPLRRDDLDDSGAALWDQIVSTRSSSVVDESGGLRGPFNPWLHAPDVGSRAADLGAHLRFGTSIERRLLELAIITVGARWKAEFEWWAHVPMAREHGVPESVIEAIGRGEPPTFERDDERIVHTVAAQLGVDGHIDAVAYAEAQTLLGDRGMVELVTLCGYYVLISFTLNAFEIGLPSGNSAAFS